MTKVESNILDLLKPDADCCKNETITKANITKLLVQTQQFQERIRNQIEQNYVDFMPNHTSSDLYLDDGETLVRECENVLKNAENITMTKIKEANTEIIDMANKLKEASLGLRVSHQILKIDDLFQCVEEASSTKEYLIVLEHLSKLKTLIYNKGSTDVDRVFQRCQCYDKIKVKYLFQLNILMENLQQRFERLVQFSEKAFLQAKNVTLQVSKDVNQLQDTVMALFQICYNPTKMCDFILKNCLEPIIKKPVAFEYKDDNAEYFQVNLSYSLKDLGDSLRPNYQQVLENIKLLFQCLGNMNVSVSQKQHVFSIIGDHINQQFLKLLVEDCLMHAVPETIDEMNESTIVKDVLEFQHILEDNFLLNMESERNLYEFTEKFETYFQNRFCKKILDNANLIMQKDLQDMTQIADKITTEYADNNAFLFPNCKISKSTLELIRLMERILRLRTDVPSEEKDILLNVITDILNDYIVQMPTIHEKLLESIPQQSVLFFNNCMFLAHWVAKNSEYEIPTFPTLVKNLQATGNKYLNVQIAYQQKLVMDILKELDLSDPHSIGTTPFKLIRQSLRQLDLLKNVWQNVLPESMYNKTFRDLINEFSSVIIKRVLAMEDISKTVADEMSELIELILEKGPTLFKEKHEVVHITCWMKLQQMKFILNASLIEITEQWGDGLGILSANYKSEEIKRLIRALFQNTDRRAKALAKIT